MVVPIISPQEVVLGTISVDSLQPALTKTKTFHPHEISFYQGVGLCLGEVHHWITVHQKLLKVAHAALDWIHRRCPAISKGEVYVVQPSLKREERGGEGEEEEGKDEKKEAGFLLSLMLSTCGTQPAVENINKKIKPHENQFLSYLFDCVENSEPVTAGVYGQHHLAYPIRDHTGCAVALVDLSMPSQHSLNPQQLREITKVLKLLTGAYYKLSCSTEEQQSGKEEPKQLRETLLSAGSGQLHTNYIIIHGRGGGGGSYSSG